MDDSSSSLAYSATQLLERTDEMSESQTSETVKRKQVGVLIIKDKEHPIYTGVNTIGRHISNQIVVKDASVSKHHAEIEGRKQLCFLTDLKSLNGSFDRFKGKFLPNRGYELINGSTIKFGQIEATLKHFFTDGNLMRTPINMRINKIIASTPESVLNNTHDESSVVYGTQAAENQAPEEMELYSHLPCNESSTSFNKIGEESTNSKKSPRFSDNSNIIPDSDSDEEGIFEKQTQKIIDKKQIPIVNKTKNIVENSSNIHQEKNEVATIYSKVEDSDKEVFKEPIKKIPDKNDSIHEYETQVFTKNDIHEMKTQTFLSPSTRISLKSKNNSKIEDSDTDEEGIFEKATQQISKNLYKIHEENTKQKSKDEDSETDEEGIFNEPTQQISIKLNKIHEKEIENNSIHENSKNNSDTDGIFMEPTQKFTTSSPKRKSKISENPNIVPDSESDEDDINIAKSNDNIHDNETQVFSKSDNIHEDKTQTFLNSSTKVNEDPKEYSNNLETEINFEGPTQKIIDNVHEIETQVFTTKSDKTQPFSSPTGTLKTYSRKSLKNYSKSFQDNNEDETVFDNIHEEKTQMLLSPSLKLKKSAKFAENFESDEIDFDGPTQKVPNIIHEDENKSDNIHEDKTQTFLSTSANLSKKSVKFSENLESDEIDFDGPTQKVTDIIHEDETELSSKSDNIHEDKTQAFLSPSASSSKKSAKFSENLESDEIDFDGPTQKITDNIQEDETELSSKSDNIHEDKTQVFLSPSANSSLKLKKSSKFLENLESDEIDFDGPTQKITDNIQEDETELSSKSDNIHEDKTQVFLSPSANSSKKSAKFSENLESDEIDFEGPTQKVSDNIQEDETELSSKSESLNLEISPKESAEIDIDGRTQKISPNDENKIHQDETQLFSKFSVKSKEVEKENSKIFETDEIDFDGLTQKLPIKSIDFQETIDDKNQNKSDNEDSDTDEEGVFEETNKIPIKLDKIQMAKNQSEKEESDTDEEGIFEGSTHETSTNLDKIQESEILENNPEIEESNTENSKTPLAGSSKTPEIDFAIEKKEKVLDPETNDISTSVLDSSPSKQNSKKITDFTGFSPRRSKRSTIIHEKVENIFKKCKTNSKTTKKSIQNSKSISENNSKKIKSSSTNVDVTNVNENSDAEVESIFKNKNSKIEDKINSNNEKVQPSTSRQLFSEKEDLKKNLKRKSSQTISSNSRKSPRISKVETNQQISTPKKQIPKSPIKKKENSSSSANYEMKSRLASVENLEYETAATQPIDDIEKNETIQVKKTLKSPKKEKSTPTRRSIRLNDTIEENLNEMFEGTSEEIVEPHQMLTQQVKNILEASQLCDEASTSNVTSKINESTGGSHKSPQVNIGSPRMSMLNIQVEKPLKKRALRTSENKEEMGKNKRAKKDENFDDDSLKSKGRPKKNTNSDNSSNSVINDSEEISNEVKKSFKITIKPKRTRNKKTKEPTIDVLNSSSSIMDDSEENLNSIQVKGENSKRTRTKRTIKDATIDIPNSSNSMADDSEITNSNPIKTKIPINSKIKKTRTLKEAAIDVPNSSNSMADDSEITNSNPIKTKIPINSKIKKTRTLKEAAIDVPNSSNSMADDLEEISNSNPIPVNSKIKKTRTPKEAAINLPNSSNSTADDLEELPNSNSIKTKIPQNSKITRTRKQKSTVNSSNSIVEDSEDSEEIPNSNQIKANIPINQKRTRTKKTNDISNSLSSTNEESKEILKLPTKRRTRKNTNDISINSSSSMNENVADVSNLNQTKEISKLPIINKKPRITKKGKIDTISNNTSSNSLVDNTLSESSLSEKIIEPKKTRGRKPKNQGENSKLENLSTNSSILSLADSDLNSSTASTSSRAKRSRFSSPSKHKVLFTGIAVKDYQKHLTKLGLQETEDINKCTILVTDKVRRTFKFLCALSRGIPILSVKWIMDSAKKSKIQVLDDYIINDSIAENKFQFNLKESLQKAKDKKMLDGWTIVLTPNITAPPVDELKEMVIACGGKALLRSPTKWTNDMIIISHEQDYENAKKFMTKAPKTVQLHSTEFLLTGILKQEINLKNYLLKIT